MASAIQMVITENNQILKKCSVQTSTQSFSLVKSLQEFQKLVNSSITQLIEDRGDNTKGDIEDDNMEDVADDEDDDDDNDDVPNTPKKRKK